MNKYAKKDKTPVLNETPYVKGSKKQTPKKSKCKHSWYQRVSYSRLRRFDGTITSEKYPIFGKVYCMDCGIQGRDRRNRDILQIEVSWSEFKKSE